MAEITSERHHWWPKSLSRYWAGPDGCVTRLSWDQVETRKSPASFGISTHAHNIRLQGGWGGSFESTFEKADGQFPALLDWLAALEPKALKQRADLTRRLTAQALPPERRRQLAECLASLIARSPGFRNLIRLTVEDARTGPEEVAANKTLIAANVNGCYEKFARSIGGGGKFLVAYSGFGEFVFGDGFLHNFTSIGLAIEPICFVSLTLTCH